MPNLITLKPHHLLDVIKLYGAGLEIFVPDLEYHHDFYKIGNLVLKHPECQVKFTLGNDDICQPCEFNQNRQCIDIVATNPPILRSKDVWNKTIDGRLMNLLGIKENEVMTVLSYCQLAQRKLTSSSIKGVWKERPATETTKRATLLLKGLNKYLKAY